MSRPALILGVLAALLGAASGVEAAAYTATARASVTVQQGAGIAVVTPLVMPTVVANVGASSPQFAGNAPSLGLISADIAGNVKLTVGGQADGMLVANQPSAYTIMRNDGAPAVATTLVNDNGVVTAGPGYQLVGEGAQLGGAVIYGDALSVDIGARIALASAQAAASAPDVDLLVVVVQYN